MTRLNEFLRDPPQFMRRHHVIFKGAGPEKQGGNVHDFLLVESTSHSARRTIAALGLSLTKADAGVFEIRACAAGYVPQQALDNGERFQAIWGGYQAGAKIQCALNADGPDLMLTPELTGCTIAFAAQNDGTARFSHYNLMDPQLPGQTLPVSNMVAEVHTDFGYGSEVGVLPKEVYRNKVKHRGGAARATVIGWRNKGQWTFWAQYIEVKGAVYQIRDVQQLRPGIRFG